MREMYDGIETLMTGEPEFPSDEYEQLTTCLDMIDPLLLPSLEKAWQGMETYWNTRGGMYTDNRVDTWEECPENRWFEVNCTSQPGKGLAIWEPCNYASNLAYNKLTQEICAQNWSIPPEWVVAMGRSFAMITFGSAFMHASKTQLGTKNDVFTNDIFAYNLHQIGMAHLPYSPVLHDLSFTPKNMTGPEIVEAWMEIYLNVPVDDWYWKQENLYHKEGVSWANVLI